MEDRVLNSMLWQSEWKLWKAGLAAVIIAAVFGGLELLLILTLKVLRSIH